MQQLLFFEVCFLEFVTEVAKEEGWEDEEDEGDED